MGFLSSPQAEKIGFALTRIVVPLWIAAGAVMKLAEKTPKLLPRNIWQSASGLDINLYWLLAVLITLEFFAIAVMLFLPRLARPMAIFMLASFCLILLGEIAVGNTKCGCLGAYSPSPWTMLAIDGALLAGVLLFAPARRNDGLIPSRGLLATTAMVVAGAVICAVVILPQNTSAVALETPTPTPTPDDASDVGTHTTTTPATVAPSRTARPLPGYHVPKVSAWQGRSWSDLELAQYMFKWPSDVDQGLRYVVFYSHSCDHCRDLFLFHFAAPPVPTTIVAIPETKAGFTPETWLGIECPSCETLDLPIGCDWIITTPIVVALQDGVVMCAKEGEDPNTPECLIWH